MTSTTINGGRLAVGEPFWADVPGKGVARLTCSTMFAEATPEGDVVTVVGAAAGTSAGTSSGGDAAGFPTWRCHTDAEPCLRAALRREDAAITAAQGTLDRAWTQRAALLGQLEDLELAKRKEAS